MNSPLSTQSRFKMDHPTEDQSLDNSSPTRHGVSYASPEQIPVKLSDEQKKEENDNTQKMNQQKSTPKVVIAPLPLDQIMSHVNQFGINLDSLEHKISENKGLGLKME